MHPLLYGMEDPSLVLAKQEMLIHTTLTLQLLSHISLSRQIPHLHEVERIMGMQSLKFVL